MQKKYKIIIYLSSVAVVFMIIAVILIMNNNKKNVLVNLSISSVDSIYVYGGFETGQAELSKQEASYLIDILNKVELNGKRSRNFRLDDGGIWKMFNIKLNDGSNFNFSADSTHYIINAEVGYECVAEIAYEIQRFHSSMLNKYFPPYTKTY